MNSEDNIVGNVLKITSDFYSFAWTINPFWICCDNSTKTKITSAEFKSGDNKEYTWYLSLDVNDSSIDVYLGLKDIRNGEKDDIVVTDYTLCILNQHRQRVNWVEKGYKFEVGEIDGSENFISKERMRLHPCEFVPNGQLTILCEMMHYVNVRRLAYKKLHKDMRVLFEDRDHSDAKIIAGGKTFHVHKAILASRSSWFKAIFKDIMKERGKCEIINLPDDSDVVQELLRFVYTTEVKGIEKVADRLFAAAHVYQLDDLKKMCSDVISDNLNVMNVKTILNLADIYLDVDLEKRALAFQNLNARLNGVQNAQMEQ